MEQLIAAICLSSRRRPLGHGAQTRERLMTLGTILLIVLILALIGAFPTWPHAKSWGYGPSGGLGIVLLIVVVLLVMGRI
jgi:hypothetical protein